MPPPAPLGRKQVVLDEDEYTEKLEAIIERDFFPDLPKMQNKLEWLQVRTTLLTTLFIVAPCCLGSPGFHLRNPPPPSRSLPSVLLPLLFLYSTPILNHIPLLSSLRPPALLLPQAVNSGDPTAIRNAQMNIAARRAGIPTPLGATPAQFATPAATPAGGGGSMNPTGGLGGGKGGRATAAGLMTPGQHGFMGCTPCFLP